MLQQIMDFEAEGRELHEVLAPLTAADWERVTAFKGWTINDVMLHLHFGDTLAAASATAGACG